MAWAARRRREVEVEDAEGRVADGDSDGLSFEVLVGGVNGMFGVGDGLMDEECEAAPGIAKAVLAEERVAREGWDRGVSVKFSLL